jgi:mannitol/fructose-specific phosphotransferase system IIA component (Ntr-type)
MRLSETLSEDLVICDLKARTKRGALNAMVRRVMRSGKAADGKAVKDAVLGREKLQSTGIGRGIAVPHSVVKCIRGLTCVMGISRKGIAYGAIDGRPVHLIFLFVNNKARNVHYLSLLASVCRLFESDSLRKQVISAGTPADVLELIRREEVKERQFPANLPG